MKQGVGPNRYAYSHNDPVNKLDPGGNGFIKDIVKSLFGDSLQRTAREAAEQATQKGMDSLRREGIKSAWAQERMLVKAGGGTYPWSEAERKILLRKGRVPNYDGHHINNVASRPDLAGVPDNVAFAKKGQKEHFPKYHPNGTKEATSGPLLGRSMMYKELTGRNMPQDAMPTMTYDGVIQSAREAKDKALGGVVNGALIGAFYGLQALDKLSPESMFLDPGYFSWETVDGKLYGNCGCAAD